MDGCDSTGRSICCGAIAYDKNMTEYGIKAQWFMYIH